MSRAPYRKRQGSNLQSFYAQLISNQRPHHSDLFQCCLEAPYKGFMMPEGNNRNAQIWTEIIPAPKAGAMTKLGDIPFNC